MRVRELTGQRFGLLVAIAHAGSNRRKQAIWFMRCDCGVEKASTHLVSGNTQSCGCERLRRTKESNVRHGMAGKKEHYTWCQMKQRCSNPNNKKFLNYGGRGISVCERWLDSFENFLSDMGLAPAANYTIDRLDSNKGYEPSNCRWTTTYHQNFNKRNTIRIILNGVLTPLRKACSETSISYNQVHKRIKRLSFSPQQAWDSVYTGGAEL